MKYVVIAEIDESKGEDITGISYNYPAKYQYKLEPGTKAVYYKDKLKDKQFEKLRLSNEPYYFGVGIIGENYPDENSKKKEFYCDILKYKPFDIAVPFKIDNEYVELIPESNKTNYWRDGVREITKETFNKILSLASLQFDENVEIVQNHISATRFDETYNLFLEFVKDESEGQEFSGFNEGFMYKAEAYKNEIREMSLAILDTVNWSPSIIGSSAIVQRVVETLELKGNNLVDTAQKYGPDALTHRKLLDSIKDGTNLIEIEQVLFDLFKTNINESNIISRLIDLVGRKYSLIAFLYYLKNDRKYLPISTTNFEFAFKELGCDLKLSQKCSWENYKAYLNVIRQVKNYLEDNLGEHINFIDAHSFLWLIGYQNRLRKWINQQGLPKPEMVFNAFDVYPINNSNNQRRTIPNESVRDSNIDWDKENRKKRIKGRRAEELVMEYERRRLVDLDKSYLAEKIEDYSTRYSKGFDVLSFNEDGTPRNIEVKASGSNGFIITRNELTKSENNPNYWIYILNEMKKEVQIKKIKAPSLRNQSQFKLEPKDYYVSFSIES